MPFRFSTRPLGLRTVEYGEFERVGGNTTIGVDVRVIGATNIDLPSAADAGRFRHDLLDRLSVAVVTIPPLRARVEDIPLLAHHFGRALAQEVGWTAFPGFTKGALRVLRGYRWPGNVRELKNVVERAVFTAEPNQTVDKIIFDPFDSPFRPTLPSTTAKESSAPGTVPEKASSTSEEVPHNLRENLAAYEKRLLERALTAYRHNQRATAAALGLNYNQLRNDLRKHALLGAGPSA